MSGRPKSKTQRAIEEIMARQARGELTLAEAARQVAEVRRAHYQAVYRALLDSVELEDSETLLPGGFGEVQLRLIGERDDVGGALALLSQVSDVDSVSDPYLFGDGSVRVYATMSRRSPLVGGVK